MDRVRIGFVGVGGMGQCAHLANYVDRPDCEVVALAELRPDLAKRVAERYGVPKVYPDHSALLADEKLDGIVASQPYRRHGILLPDLFKAGTPVLTEKPLTGSIEAGEKILQALQSSSARHYLGYHKRSDPATMYVKEEMARLANTNELGPMRYVRVVMPPGDWVAAGFAHLLGSDEPLPPLDMDPLPSDLSPDDQAAYDAFVNYYIHQVNLMRHILGEDYSVSYADPTQTLLVVHSASGVPGVIEMSTYQTSIDWQEEILITYAHGYIKLELPAPLASNRAGRVTLFRDPGEGAVPQKIQPDLPWVHAMRQQATNFIAAIRGEQTPLCEAPEALKDLQIAREYMRAVKGV